jgi:heat shock protein HtpX
VIYVATFTIETETPSTDFGDLLKFIQHYYVLSHPEFFRFTWKGAVENVPTLSFRAFDDQRLWWIDVEVKVQNPIQVEMRPNLEIVPKEVIDSIKNDLVDTVQLFEDKVRNTTLYFAWVEGRDVIPEAMPSMKSRSLNRLFRSNMIFMYVISIALGILLFSFLGNYAIIFFFGFQFIIVLISNKIVHRLGNWKIDSKNPYIHLLEYDLPKDHFNDFQEKYSKDLITQMKKEIYSKTFSVGKEPTCEVAGEVFSKYGFKCEPSRMTGKKVNVYDIVRRAAEKFSLPIPEIVISNTMLPNAAATGPSPNHATVLMTTGLFVRLQDDEILNVIGHEMGHVKGRDPLWLFGLMTFGYALFLLLPSSSFLSFFYFIIIMSVIYFLAKFFETRADLYSAVVMGEPKILAESLRKIAFRKLQLERIPQFRLQAWLMWDPHPPTYFRINRLEKMKTPVKVRHLLIQSAKDVFGGFRAAL